MPYFTGWDEMVLNNAPTLPQTLERMKIIQNIIFLLFVSKS